MREASGECDKASESELALGFRECAPLAIVAVVFSLPVAPLGLAVASAAATPLVANTGKKDFPLARAPKILALSFLSSPPFISNWDSGCCCDSSKRKRGKPYLQRYGRDSRVAS